jgi:hypothetical protein
MSSDGAAPDAACAGCGSGSACPKRAVPIDPRRMTVEERRAWLESYRQHLEERLAEVNEQLAALA